MLLLSEIRPELHRRALTLVPDRYESFDELLNLALENQIRLEEKGVSGPLAAGRDPLEDSGDKLSSGGPESDRADAFRCVKALASDLALEPGDPPDPTSWSMSILWGQVNRLLPVVAGIRTLGHLLGDSEVSEVPLALWHERASTQAADLRDVLLVKDHEMDRRRGELWSTGFPGRDRASSRRYANQFLGRGSTRAPGAAEMIGLISIDRSGDETMVKLTPAGIRWSSLSNPVFDSDGESNETVSEEETRLYLKILAEQLPEERRFMALLGELIEATESRTALEEEMVRRRPELKKYASTMRAGAIGRLHDLGLLVRHREGTAVEYRLAERARRLGLTSFT
jgi:hypothetical protein